MRLESFDLGKLLLTIVSKQRRLFLRNTTISIILLTQKFPELDTFLFSFDHGVAKHFRETESNRFRLLKTNSLLHNAVLYGKADKFHISAHFR